MAEIWGTILVEGPRGEGTRYHKASVRIDRDTEVLSQGPEGASPRKPDDLKVGVKVEVYFSGPIAYSHPVKAKARKIVIMPSGF